MRTAALSLVVLLLLPIGVLHADDEEAPPGAKEEVVPPPLPSALRAMRELMHVAGESGARVVGLDVKPRIALVRVEGESVAILDALSGRLENSKYFRARDTTRVVHLGAAQPKNGRWQAEVGLRFDPEWRDDGVLVQASSISQAFVAEAAAEVGLQSVYRSRERMTPYGGQGACVITHRYEFGSRASASAGLTLASLETLLESVSADGRYHVTEIQWTRRDTADEGEVPDDVIVKPRIEIAAFFVRDETRSAPSGPPAAGAGTTPALPDAARAMRELARAVGELPARVLRMNVKRRSATLRVAVEDTKTLDLLSQRLEQNAYLSDRARDRTRVVEVGAATMADGRWRADFELRFADPWYGDGVPLSTGHISAAFLDTASVRAGLRKVYASRSRATTHSSRRCQEIAQRFDYDAPDSKPASLTLEKLERLLELVSGEGHYRVTEIAWARLDTAGEGDVPDDAIKKPQIEIAAWHHTPR